MNIPESLKYTKDHEWIRVEGDMAFIGITDFAQKELGDIVFVEVETVGETLDKEETFGTIEAVKTVSDLLMPIGGEVLEFNDALESSPEMINAEPYEGGWIVKIRMSDASEVEHLYSAEGYRELIEA